MSAPQPLLPLVGRASSHHVRLPGRGRLRIEVRYRIEVAGAWGDGRLQHLDLRDRDSGKIEQTPAAGLFVLIGVQPYTGWLPGTVARDQWATCSPDPVPPDPGGSCGLRCSWRPACPACSPSGTSGTGRSSGSPPPWARARSPFALCTSMRPCRPPREPRGPSPVSPAHSTGTIVGCPPAAAPAARAFECYGQNPPRSRPQECAFIRCPVRSADTRLTCLRRRWLGTSDECRPGPCPAGHIARIRRGSRCRQRGGDPRAASRPALRHHRFPCRSRWGCWLAGGRRCRAVADACGAVIVAARSQRTEPSALTGGICAGSA
jgi:hypothetical protein